MIKVLRQVAMVLAIASLGACASGLGPQEGSSSAQGPVPSSSGAGPKQGPVFMAAQYDVEKITINVPRTLVVSEANSYRPTADIVWRGEPIGDRYAQVEAILTEAMATGTATMTAGPQVDIEITLVRFHCVTERTRYSIGGLHSMEFELTVRDTATGAIIDGPRLVDASIKASGGARAIAEDRAGRTQRVVVSERLAEAIRFELSAEVPLPVSDTVLLSAY